MKAGRFIVNHIFEAFGLARLRELEASCDRERSLRLRLVARQIAWESILDDMNSLGAEYADYRAASEDRLRAIVALETPHCAHVGKHMAKLARAGLGPQESPVAAAAKTSGWGPFSSRAGGEACRSSDIKRTRVIRSRRTTP